MALTYRLERRRRKRSQASSPSLSSARDTFPDKCSSPSPSPNPQVPQVTGLTGLHRQPERSEGCAQEYFYRTIATDHARGAQGHIL